jgi:adenylate kinase family enzyme
MDQAAGFEELVGHAKMVLFFDAPDAVLVQRLVERGKTSGRADDNEEAIKKRLVTYHTQSAPVISLYEPRGLVRKVNAVQSVDDVYADVQKVLSEFRKQQIVLIAGQPLSGKTLLCKSLARTGMFEHIAMADLLRDETMSGSDCGREIANAVRSGKPVPGHIIVELIQKAVAQCEGAGKIIVDGFPRNITELTQLTGVLGQPHSVIYLDCAEGGGIDVVKARNAADPQGGDAEAAEAKLQARFDKFEAETVEMIKSFEAKGILKTIKAAHHEDEEGNVSETPVEGGKPLHSIKGLKLVYDACRELYGF